MGHLQKLAWEVGAPERSLRRAVSVGTLRCRRPSPRRLEVDAAERAYLRSHWELLVRLRAVLRTEPNVRFAAIFGSMARGDERADSDLDMVVELGQRDRRGRTRLAGKLEAASGRRVQMLHLRDLEECAPDLLGEVVLGGRVLVDRDERWPGLLRERRRILQRARQADEQLQAAERKAIIESNYDDLKESLRRHYPDDDSFVADWTSTEFEAQERIAALERFYERIVNALNQVVDDAERALGGDGKLPKASPPKRGQEPGRWQRLADYGALPAKHVDPMRRLIGKRNIFQKEYDTLGAEAGADIFDEAKEFARLLPKVIPSIHEWAGGAIRQAS